MGAPQTVLQDRQTEQSRRAAAWRHREHCDQPGGHFKEDAAEDKAHLFLLSTWKRLGLDAENLKHGAKGGCKAEPPGPPAA